MKQKKNGNEKPRETLEKTSNTAISKLLKDYLKTSTKSEPIDLFTSIEDYQLTHYDFS